MTAAATAAINGAVMMGTGNPSAASGLAGGHASQTGFKAKLSPNAVILIDTFPNLAGTGEIQARNTASITSSIGNKTRSIGGLTDYIFSLTGRIVKLAGSIVSLTRSISCLTRSISTLTGSILRLAGRIANETGSIISLTGRISAKPAAFSVNQQHSTIN